jgi:alpha-N-arabinofuranosidase
VPVTWEREPFEWKAVKYDWPVASPLTGRVERTYPLPFPGYPQVRRAEFTDDFSEPDLGLEWNFRRVPLPGSWSLQANPGYLRLHALPGVIRERGRAALLGVRQTETEFAFETRMLFSPVNDGSEAGMALFQKDDNYIAYTLKREEHGFRMRLALARPGAAPAIRAEEPIPGYAGEISLRASWRDGGYVFEWAFDEGGDYRTFASLPGDVLLSRGYTGAYLGLYATANGGAPGDHADFDRVAYRAVKRP